jgi:hypothetical protein
MPAGNSAARFADCRRPGPPFVETYCYAVVGTDLLEDEPQQLYWRPDIVRETPLLSGSSSDHHLYWSRRSCKGGNPVNSPTRLTEFDLPLDWTEQHRLLAS